MSSLHILTLDLDPGLPTERQIETLSHRLKLTPVIKGPVMVNPGDEGLV